MLSGFVVLLYLLSIAVHYMGIAVQTSQDAVVLARDAELKALLDEQARVPRTRRVQDVPTPLLAAIRAWAA